MKKTLQGLRIGVCALSGPVPRERLEEGLAILEDAGAWPVLAPNLFRCDRLGLTAGSEQERLTATGQVLEDGVDVVWLARGGHGLVPLLPQVARLPWRRTGVVVGFSDATALFVAISKGKGSPRLVHGPMVCGLSALSQPDRREVADVVAGARPRPAKLSRLAGPDRPVSGVLRGGCLSVLAALAGTRWALRGSGAILVIEDVDEPAYRLDRLLAQLELSGSIRGLQAVVLGTFEGCAQGKPGLARDVLVRRIAGWGVPVWTGLKAGHGKRNTAFVIGNLVRISGSGEMTWLS